MTKPVFRIISRLPTPIWPRGNLIPHHEAPGPVQGAVADNPENLKPAIVQDRADLERSYDALVPVLRDVIGLIEALPKKGHTRGA